MYTYASIPARYPATPRRNAYADMQGYGPDDVFSTMLDHVFAESPRAGRYIGIYWRHERLLGRANRSPRRRPRQFIDLFLMPRLPRRLYRRLTSRMGAVGE